MARFLRTTTLIVLPMITIALGWQLGARYEQHRLTEVSRRLELLYSGKTASGIVVDDPEDEVDISLLWGVWRLLLANYIAPDEMKPDEMVFGAVAGMVESIEDPYTSFMTPKEHEDFEQSLQGKLEGIGAELTMRNNNVVVVAPLKGSPAKKAGLEPEDMILEVDGTDIEGETLGEVVQRIRGKKGTEVTLTIARADVIDPFDITITRAKIDIPSVEYEILETATGSIAWIQLNQFGDQSVKEVHDALSDIRKKDVQGLVLDVRFNGGGYLEGAVDIASMFLKSGKIVTVERRDGEPVHHYVSGRPSDAEIPMAILINEGSASSSEILAGSLQDLGRAKVVGMKSFGKGTVQEVFELPGEASVRITIARWLTPSGHDLSKEGLEPDIVVDRTREQATEEIDPQLDAAIEWLLDGEQLADAPKEEE